MKSVISDEFKSIPEPFSIDGIIRVMEKACVKNYKSCLFLVYFVNPKNSSVYLWYKNRNEHFDFHDEIACESVRKKSDIIKNGLHAFILHARGHVFGAVIINETECDLRELKTLIDYFALLLYSEKLSFTANRDKLTKIYNRSFIYALLEKYSKNKTQYSIIMFDVDKFKHYNDKYGHAVGDHVLKKLIFVIKKNIPKSYCFGRYGGEEFMLIVRICDKKKIKTAMENIRNIVLKTDFSTDKYALKLTISLGGCVRDENSSYDDVIENADNALYKAKQMGRNRSVLY